MQMAASNINNSATAKQEVSPIPVPSQLWCAWQAFKGTNARRLTISDVDLRNKWILLTGGNSGVGSEAALQFVKWGANIILGCREPPPREMHPDDAVQMLKDAALAAGHKTSVIEWWECDMSSLQSVEAFGRRWLSTGRPLDILVNNAGIGGASKDNQHTQDGFETIHQVNFISHVLLTMVLLPSLALASKPRIVCTTSCMQYFGVFDLANANSGKDAYKNNKLYFQTWLTELQAQMLKHATYSHIIIQGVHPGYVKTNIWGWPQEAGPTSWLNWGLGVLLKYVGIDAQQGSLAIVHAATSVEFDSQRRSLHTDNNACEGRGRYTNRIWNEKAMPQTMHLGCRHQVWQFVNKELMLGEKGLLHGLGI